MIRRPLLVPFAFVAMSTGCDSRTSAPPAGTTDTVPSASSAATPPVTARRPPAIQADTSLPAGSPSRPTSVLKHPDLPITSADTSLRRPFQVIRHPAHMERVWRSARGRGPVPTIDFGQASVLALRLPAGARADDLAPRAFQTPGGTQVVLAPGSPSHVGVSSGDKIVFYEIPLSGGPLLRVRYPSRLP